MHQDLGSEVHALHVHAHAVVGVGRNQRHEKTQCEKRHGVGRHPRLAGAHPDEHLTKERCAKGHGQIECQLLFRDFKNAVEGSSEDA